MKAARNLRKGPRLQYLVGSLRALGRTHPAFEKPCGPTWKTKLYELACLGGCVSFCRGDRELFSPLTPLTIIGYALPALRFKERLPAPHVSSADKPSGHAEFVPSYRSRVSRDDRVSDATRKGLRCYGVAPQLRATPVSCKLKTGFHLLVWQPGSCSSQSLPNSGQPDLGTIDHR